MSVQPPGILPDISTAELTLVAACSAWPLTDVRLEAIGKAAVAGLDWVRVVALIDRHRVAGLVQHALGAARVPMPADAANALRQRARADAVQELRQAHLTIRLSRSLTQSGIRHAVLKGVTTARMAFGRFGVRYSTDIDLLIEFKDVAAATALLNDAGFVRSDPPAQASAKVVAAWMARHKDVVFMHEDEDMVVELHWRLFQNPRLMPDTAEGPLSSVTLVGTASVPTLPEETAWLYLCVHGGEHGWARLKWLADLGALLSRSNGEAIRLYAHASALGLRRLVGPGIVLCAKVYGTNIPDRLRKDFAGDRRMRWLTRIAWRSLVGDETGTELENLPGGATRKNLGHYLVVNDPRHWWHEFMFDLHDSGRGTASDSGSARLRRLAAQMGKLMTRRR